MARARTLATYRAKRDFEVTSEPRGDRRVAAAGDAFVVQKHAARRLHYDFRLELDGVLLSWSVPKGPSLQPGERRLAVRTEDHPLDYADFEGIIPAGQYGGGAVVVWDRGRWKPKGDPRDGLAKGRLTFELDGVKLKGRFHLVRTKGESWLLFKGNDEAASDEDLTKTRPESVLSGKTIEAIAEAPPRVWQSNRAPPVVDLVKQLPVGFALTNLDKVLYPEQGLTKAQVIAYLAVVAERMLPHVAHRPLMVLRCPEGRGKPCFFQKHPKDGTPDAVDTVEIDGKAYMVVDELAGLVALAQLGSLELHTWACRADQLERPDRLVLDLDPDPGVAWGAVVEAALGLRALLAELDLTSFVTTTGGKGLHVVVPLTRRVGWDDHKAFARGVADAMVAASPARFTASASKAHRKGKIFVDYLRNGRGATFIAPYSMRARAGAPVATPVTWDELASIDPASLTIETVPTRISADPWAEMRGVRQGITAAARRRLVRGSQ